MQVMLGVSLRARWVATLVMTMLMMTIVIMTIKRVLLHRSSDYENALICVA